MAMEHHLCYSEHELPEIWDGQRASYFEHACASIARFLDSLGAIGPYVFWCEPVCYGFMLHAEELF